ncbi:MAG TPA: SDR family NAD(P)-dependent oxidoreductase [Candidatus Limnocylindria bacterium]|nr:SDR family NAD(P)-dependent oxidoreductase [Candidatus Limnocylindria bacterium]
MKLRGTTALVSGGASGLGRATSERLSQAGARVTILDLPASDGEGIARKIGGQFVAADVTDEAQVAAAVERAAETGPLRILVHTAGRSGPGRVVERDGSPAPLDHFAAVVGVNLIGTFNVLRLAAAAMASTEPIDGERGVCILTASIAGYEGQIGQVPYASSKAGVIGMTLVAARDLARRQVRVCTIAPGIFETPMLHRHSAEARAKFGEGVPHPQRLGDVDEYAALAEHIIENSMLNGETIRLDGALRMPPK